MRSKRPKARQCKNLAKQHVDDPDEPAAPDGDSGYAEWVQIAIILLRVEIDKNLHETEAYLNDMIPILDERNLEHSPDHTTICRWEKESKMRELRCLLRRSAEQAGWTGVGAVDEIGFQCDQTALLKMRYGTRIIASE